MSIILVPYVNLQCVLEFGVLTSGLIFVIIFVNIFID